VSPDFIVAIDEYFTGLSAGVDAADQVLQARAATCPRERIVLAGRVIHAAR
jgi:hypothetical protein